jgi:hypothetical protein
MAHPVTLLDRIRIERAVWSLDQRLYDLPRRSRVAHRRELRDDLLAASRHTGASGALRDLGAPGTLAAAYLDAALGSGPRHSWTAAGAFVLTAAFVLTSLLFDAAEAFGDGILAGDPNLDGTFSWPGLSYLQTEVTYTVADGGHRFTGGAFTPLCWLLLATGGIAVGRLWRALPLWATRRER